MARNLFPPQTTPRIRLPQGTQREIAVAVRARDWKRVAQLKEMFEFSLEQQMEEEEEAQQRKIQKIDALKK